MSFKFHVIALYIKSFEVFLFYSVHTGDILILFVITFSHFEFPFVACLKFKMLKEFQMFLMKCWLPWIQIILRFNLLYSLNPFTFLGKYSFA